ncbi:acylphosphatase [Microvirga sp. TS319]|uniref:acylphosphatase n=1 Tax=Microvirga sp. TS319 TaxID=3241165 RepID=UPI003519F6EA
MIANRIAHVRIHGRVQGVGFRVWTQHQAQLHGLTGWVRNRADGSVEAVFSGPGEMVEVMLKACHEGPAGSLVQLVEPVEGADHELDHANGFEVRRTA